MTIQDARHQTPTGRVPGKRPPLWTITLGPLPLHMESTLWRGQRTLCRLPARFGFLCTREGCRARLLGTLPVKIWGHPVGVGTLLSPPPQSVSRALRVARVAGSLERSAGKPLGAGQDNQTWAVPLAWAPPLTWAAPLTRMPYSDVMGWTRELPAHLCLQLCRLVQILLSTLVLTLQVAGSRSQGGGGCQLGRGGKGAVRGTG